MSRIKIYILNKFVSERQASVPDLRLNLGVVLLHNVNVPYLFFKELFGESNKKFKK